MDISILYFLTQADFTIICFLTIIYAMPFEFPPPPLPKFNHNSFALMKNCAENRLLQNQTDALEALLAWFGPDSPTREQISLVSMPTGSGKTGVMACLPYFLGSIGLIDQPLPTGNPSYLFDKPILVISPDLEIAKQLERQLHVSVGRRRHRQHVSCTKRDSTKTQHQRRPSSHKQDRECICS